MSCPFQISVHVRIYVLEGLICGLTTFADPEGGTLGGLDTPLENHKAIGFLSNTGPESLENHKATKPAFNIGPSLALQRIAIKWCFAGGLMTARF